MCQRSDRYLPADLYRLLHQNKAELAQVGTFFPARISALASKMGQIKKIKTYCHAN